MKHILGLIYVFVLSVCIGVLTGKVILYIYHYDTSQANRISSLKHEVFKLKKDNKRLDEDKKDYRESLNNISKSVNLIRKDRDRLSEIIRANHSFIDKPVECVNVCHSGYCQKYKKDFDSKVVEILGDKSCPYVINLDAVLH